MSDDEKAPVVQETMQVIETPEGLDEMFEGMVEQSVKVSEKAKKPVVGTRKYLISQIRELCGKVDMDPKSFKLSRCKKGELKQILADLVARGAEQVMKVEVEEVGVAEEVTENAKDQFIVASLTRLKFCMMSIIEIGSQKLDLGFEIRGWVKTFEDNKEMKKELQVCIYEIWKENEWLTDYLNCWSRMAMLMLSSAMMCLKKQERVVIQSPPHFNLTPVSLKRQSPYNPVGLQL